MSHDRPGVEQLPTPADEAAARAMHRLRPAGLPWAALAAAGRRNLAVSAQPLRRALVREGWTPPGVAPSGEGSASDRLAAYGRRLRQGTPFDSLRITSEAFGSLIREALDTARDGEVSS